MSMLLPSLGRFAAPVLSMTALLTLLAAESASAAQIPGTLLPQAHASFQAQSGQSPLYQLARLTTALELNGQTEQPGLTATFGWLEGSDQILLMSHGAFGPASLLARSERKVESTTPIHALGELPRFLMVCSWREGDESGAPTVAYAERDDANGRVSSTRTYASLSVPWIPTEEPQAQQPFAARDWCGEIAHSGQSSAPLWQSETITR